MVCFGHDVADCLVEWMARSRWIVPCRCLFQGGALLFILPLDVKHQTSIGGAMTRLRLINVPMWNARCATNDVLAMSRERALRKHVMTWRLSGHQ